jgi:hypothetical protein
MSITINQNGSITLSDIIKGQLINKTFYFYTLSQAKKEFKEYLKTL